MSDQAQSLRNLKQRANLHLSSPEVITITSGKGGVGKSNTSVNLAISLGNLGMKVLLIDVDLGFANADLLLGIYSKYNLFDFINNNMPLDKVITKVNENVHLLSGGSALADVEMIEHFNAATLNQELQNLLGYKYIIFDTGAGINKNVTYFSLIADRVIIVTTPEPTSITDAYSLIKSLYKSKGDIFLNIVVNKATTEAEGRKTADKLIKVANNFLNKNPIYLGYISEDKNVTKAVKNQVPYTQAFESCAATKDLRALANLIAGKENKTEKKGLFNIFGSLFGK